MLFLFGLLALGSLVPSAQAAAPVFTLQPASQSTTVGQPVVFVSNAGGTPPIEYRWRRNNADIPGATNRNFAIPSAQLTDDGAQFYVIATNISGSATSTVATLTVAPDNTPPTVGKVGNTANFMQIKVKFSERVSGSVANDPANYQLDHPGVNITSAVLAQDGTNVTLTVSPALTEGDNYTLSIANIVDLANNPLSPDPTMVPFQAAVPPQITSQPQDHAVNPGQFASFSVTASGTDPLSFRWYKDLTPLAEISNTIQFPAVTQADLGNYYVVVMNSAGSVTSIVVHLSFMDSYQLDLPAGDSLIASHYSNPGPFFPPVPLGTTLTIWRVPSAGFQMYIFDDFGGGAGEWAPSTPTFNPGEGAVLHLPSPAALVFTGQRITPMVPSNYPSAFNLIGAQVPISAGYDNLVASPPKEGQIVYQLRPGGNANFFDENNYRLTFFRYGMWHDGPPKLNVGESAWVGFADPVGFTTQPVGQTNVPPGQTVNFFVNVTGAPPVHFQWLLNGSPIPGATNPGYGFAMSPTNGGRYSVVAGNVVGDVVSDVVSLTPNIAGFNMTDSFDLQESDSSFTRFLSSHNRGATREAVEPPHAGKRANASVWLTWIAPTTGIISMSTAGSGFDTILAAYTGNSIGNLTPIQASDDDAGYACSRIAFNAVGGTPYRICVAGLGDETGDIVLSWVFQPTAQKLPDILTQPQDLSVGVGALATFTVMATNGSLSYQWFRDGVALSGNIGTNATLGINNAGFDDVGYYFVRVSNGQRTRDSEIVSLQLEIAQAGQPLTGARGAPKFFDLNLSGGTNGTPLKGGGPSKLIVGTVNHGYSGAGNLPCSLGRDPGEPFPGSIYGANTSWYAVQADTNGTMYVNTDGSSFDTVIAAYIGPGNSFTTLTNVAWDNNSGLDGYDSRMNFPAVTGTTYFFQVQGVGAASGIAAISYRLVRPLSITNLVYTNGFGGRFTMKVNSTSNLLTRVQYSTNFSSTNWITLTNYTSISNSFNFTNSSVGSSSNRYYRALNVF